MGEILEVICTNCNYNPKNVTLGAGKSNHLTYCGAPVINFDNNEVETVNYFNSIIEVEEKIRHRFFFKKTIKKHRLRKKGNYKFFFEDGMFIENKGKNSTHIWGDLEF